jgi:hypothetical protein
MDKNLYDKQSSSEFSVTDPNGRLKALSDCGNSVEIDNNIPPRRWVVRFVLIQCEYVCLDLSCSLHLKDVFVVTGYLLYPSLPYSLLWSFA